MAQQVAHIIRLPYLVQPTLGCGAELKSSVCLAAGDWTYLSQPIGDLEDWNTYLRYQQMIAEMQQSLQISPQIVAYDLHPEYLSTKYALEHYSGTQTKLIGVQHHHAHLVACMAEHGIDDRVIGVSADGTGWGTDGHIWGGEIMLADYAGFARRGHLAYFPLPGGTMAIREPYRVAIGLLYSTFGDNAARLDIPLIKQQNDCSSPINRPVSGEGTTGMKNKLEVLFQMIHNNINSPLTSSLGRLFDGVSALLGICYINNYEGQAAIELERAAVPGGHESYPYNIIDENGMYVVDFRPLIEHLAEDIKAGISAGHISYRFHYTVATFISDICRRLREETGLTQAVLSGGVFQNKLLLSLLTQMLEGIGLQVLTHKILPSNDSHIALGQVLVANAQLMGQKV